MHRLQPVAHIGQRAADDHAHRVIEVGAPHLVGDGDRLDVAGGERPEGVLFSSAKAGIEFVRKCRVSSASRLGLPISQRAREITKKSA